MSVCFTQVFASFVPVDSSLTIEKMLSHLQQVIASEVYHDEFDVAGAYGLFADAFDYDVAFDTLAVDHHGPQAGHCQIGESRQILFRCQFGTAIGIGGLRGQAHMQGDITRYTRLGADGGHEDKALHPTRS